MNSHRAGTFPIGAAGRAPSLRGAFSPHFTKMVTAGARRRPQGVASVHNGPGSLRGDPRLACLPLLAILVARFEYGGVTS